MIWGAPHVQGQVAIHLLLDPSQHIVEFGAFRNVLGRGRVSQNELRLSPAAVQGCDGKPCGIGGDGGAVVPDNHVQAEIQAGRRARRCQHLTRVDVENVGIEIHRRVGGAEQVGGEPMGGRALSIEQPSLGECERSRADRRDPGARGIRGLQRVEHFIGRADTDVVATGNDDRVRPVDVIDAVIGGDAHRPRADDRVGAAHQHPISRLTRRQHHPAEHLDRGG